MLIFAILPTWLLGPPDTIRLRVLELISALVGLIKNSPSTKPTRTAPAWTQTQQVDQRHLHSLKKVYSGTFFLFCVLLTYGSIPWNVRQGQSSWCFNERKQRKHSTLDPKTNVTDKHKTKFTCVDSKNIRIIDTIHCQQIAENLQEMTWEHTKTTNNGKI